MRVKVPAYVRRDGTSVSGYEYDRWSVASDRLEAAKGLRGKLDDGPAVSGYEPQPLVGEAAYMNATDEYWAKEKNWPYRRSNWVAAGQITTGFAGVGGAVIAAAFLGPLAAPAVLAAAGLLTAAPAIADWFVMRSIRRKRHAGRTPTRKYRREAQKLAESQPHWFGEVPEHSSSYEESNYDAKFSVDSDGVADIRWRYKGGRRNSGVFYLYPGVKIHGEVYFPLDVPGVNMRGAEMTWWTLPKDSNMDGADLRDIEATDVSWNNTSLRFANFAGANLQNSNLRWCDVEGANFEGADLTGARLPVDLRGVRITREQFDSLAYRGTENFDSYTVKEISFDDLVDECGGDLDLATMMLWSGEFEVRERLTNEVVTGEFDPKEHYIPHWVLSELKQSAK